MQKKFQLQVAEPCHENWENMTPVEQGKFCGSCQKQVVDFTTMNDRQIAEFFKKPTTGSVCGRFMNDQLERDIEIPKKRIPWVKYFFSIALPAFFFSRANAQKMGKPKLTEATDTITRPVETDRIMLGMVVPDRIVPEENKKVIPGDMENMKLKVWVVDEQTAMPVAGAAVRLNTSSGNETVYTGEDGSVLLRISLKNAFHGIRISAAGYTGSDISYGEFRKATDGRYVFKIAKEKPAICDRVRMDTSGTTQVPKYEVLMGAVMYDPGINPVILPGKNRISGVVVNGNNEPVPFASIMGGKKGEGVMADEHGVFVIERDWLKKGRSLQVTSVGYQPAMIKAGEEQYRDAQLYVQLEAVNMQEVVVTAGSGIGCLRSATVGYVTISKGQVLVVDKTENKTNTEIPGSMNKPILQVYPNPVVAGGGVSLSFNHPEEGYYQLQIVSAAGQLVKQQEIWLDAEARLLQIDLPVLTAGTYFMVMAGKRNGKKYSEKIVVQ